MSRFLYTSPQGKYTADPDERLLRHALFEQPWEEWWHSPNNSASLQVILDDGEEGDCSIEGHIPTNTFFRVSQSHPCLAIFQPEPDEFFIVCFENGGEFYHCSDGSFEEFAVYHSGGEQCRIPRACLIGPQAALHILLEFTESFSRSTEVEWRRREELPVSDDFWDPL